MEKKQFEMSRRCVLKYGMMSGAILVGSRAMSWAQVVCPPEKLLPEPTTCGISEVWATTPFIVNPFTDPLPQPQALRPGYWRPDGQLLPPNDPAAWAVRKWTDKATGVCRLGSAIVDPALMEDGMQDSYGASHSVKPTTNNPNIGFPGNFPLVPNPILYHIRLQIAAHNFTSPNVRVRPIDKNGNPLTQAELDELGIPINLNADGTTTLPASTIYGFNGTFPGPLVNVDYGKPAIIRFECDLDSNPLGLDTSDFGVPQFLTHLHNGHTAPESDGNPHYMQHNEGGYIGGDYVDNLYLNWPAGGDPNEMQSYLWFHDHRMHHTGANVYKGMVGLYLMYDPGVPDPDSPGSFLPGTGLDPGDERIETGLRLPGIREENGDGSFNVKYDIPLALFDCRLDDGFTPHADFRIGDELIVGDPPAGTPPPADPNVCGGVHPNQWGKTFFRYHPNHGFVGDLFTVNCVAFPVLNVERRKYRLRFLGASIARCYEIAFMTSQAGPQARPGTDGQWQIPDGVLWKQNAMTQIASMGGLLPNPIPRDLIQIWPAQRREVVVDFSDTQIGDVIYITNVLDMKNGRKPDYNDPDKPLEFKVPIVKIVVTGDPPEPDQSQVPATLRPLPEIPPGLVPPNYGGLPHRVFRLHRSGQFGDDSQWLINGLPFDPTQSLTELPGPGNPGGIGNPKLGSAEVWTLENGGGGWTHPMHIHQEEHVVLFRQDGDQPDLNDPGKEDVANLDEGESVTVFRRFRTFTGQYVAHCHNLAHEDHNMMFGWKIDAGDGPPPSLAPRAFGDEFAMSMNSTGVIPVLANDTTFDGRPLTAVESIAVSLDPSNGSAVPSGNSITYTPNENFSGTDSFSYTITVDGVTSRPATVTVTVAPANAPIARNDQHSMSVNTIGVIPVLANDTTFDGLPLPENAVITLTGNAPFNGRAEVTGSTITYTPDDGFIGTDSFTYTVTVDRTVTDPGATSLPATVSVAVLIITRALNVNRAVVRVRGRRVARRGPRWNIKGFGADPGAQITIQAGGVVVATVQANRRGNWRFVGRAVPGLTNPTAITISSPGAQTLTVPLTVR